jgi:type VII secretion protein EccB
MASRRDQLHSYQFLMQRVISSVMLHEPDPEQTPLRRGVGAVFGGVMIAVLVAAGFGVYGILTGVEANRWRTQGAVIIERETGAHYVYQEGGILQPVLNYTSALLISGGGSTHRVAGRSLTNFPRAVPVGIPGAPESLPPADRVTTGAWTWCSSLEDDGLGRPVATTTLLVGRPVPGGEPLVDRGLLVRQAGTDTHHLIWQGHRYPLGGLDPAATIRSLYGFQAEAVEVGAAWLNGLPAGQQIAPPDTSGITDWGEPSKEVPGYTVGDLVHHRVAGGEQHYLVLPDGLAPLTELQVMLLRADHPQPALEIPVAVVNRSRTSHALVQARGEAAPPDTPPELVTSPTGAETTVCAQTADAATPPVVTLGGDRAAFTGALPTGGEAPTGVRLADQVVVPAGQAAVIRVMPSPQAPTGSYQLVTETGVRYPVPTTEILTWLGYDAGRAVELPAAVVQQVPAGPTLTPDAAWQTVSGAEQ